MGLIRTSIQLSNPRSPELSDLTAIALVDTGALHLCIPQAVAFQLNLGEIEKRPVTIASGETIMCPYVGPIQIKWEKRSCFVGAMVIGDEILLGAIPLEDMDLIIHPATLKLSVNPAHPNLPVSVAK